MKFVIVLIKPIINVVCFSLKLLVGILSVRRAQPTLRRSKMPVEYNWNELRTKLDELVEKELGPVFFTEKWRLDGLGNQLMSVLHGHFREA